MKRTPFTGVFTPLINPCDTNNALLEDLFVANARHLFEEGVDGLYLNGGTGDTFQITVDERRRTTELATGLAKEYAKQVIVHVGGCAPRDAIDLSVHAASLGAGALASMPPAFLTFEKLVDYYGSLHRASGLPVFVYYFPTATRVYPSYREIVTLINIPGVIGLKISDWNTFLVTQLKAEKPDIVIYNGFDELLGAGLMAGCDGTIGSWSNMFPKLYVLIFKAARERHFEEVLRLQSELSRILLYANRYGITETMESLARRMGIAPRSFRKLGEATDLKFDALHGEEIKKIADSLLY